MDMDEETRTKERIVHLIGGKIYDYFPCLESAHRTPHLFFAQRSFFDSLSFFRSQHKVYRLTIKVGKTSRVVFVKIRENAVSAQKEYEKTLHLWKTFSSENFSVSRPLDILPEINAVVFSKVDGVSLQSLLNRAFFFGEYTFNGTHLIEYITIAGKWLRAFHDAFRTRRYLIDVDKILSQIENWLKSSSVEVEEKLIRVICNIARNKAKENRPEDLKISLLHTTFDPAHIFICDRKVAAIDFEKVRYGPIYYDLFNFTLSLDFMFKIFRSHVSDLKKSFFLGYFGEDPIPESTMQLFKIHRIARKLCFPLPATFQNKLVYRLHARMAANRTLGLFKEIKRNRTVNLFD